MCAAASPVPHMPFWHGAQLSRGLFNKAGTWKFIIIQLKNVSKCAYAWTLGIFMLIVEKKNMWAS
jgi:hypothetical protein